MEIKENASVNNSSIDWESGKCTELHVGKAIDDFLGRVDMIETRIGEYGSREMGAPVDLVVSGHHIQDLKTPTWIYTDISTTLDATPKFKSVYGKNAIQLLTAYYKQIGKTDEELADIKDKVKRLDKNKLVILPFKPNTNCSVDIDIDGLGLRKDMHITYIKWRTCRETFKLKCEIAFQMNTGLSNKCYKHSITDYLEKFRIINIDMQGKSKKIDNKIIQVTDYGIFKPIEIQDSETRVAIDGSYLYSIGNNDDITIIGHWENDDLVVTMDNGSRALKKLIDSLPSIKAHKRYIAPYNTFEAAVLKIK